MVSVEDHPIGLSTRLLSCPMVPIRRLRPDEEVLSQEAVVAALLRLLEAEVASYLSSTEVAVHRGV